jgi:hypothetical protein
VKLGNAKKCDDNNFDEGSNKKFDSFMYKGSHMPDPKYDVTVGG